MRCLKKQMLGIYPSQPPPLFIFLITFKTKMIFSQLLKKYIYSIMNFNYFIGGRQKHVGHKTNTHTHTQILTGKWILIISQEDVLNMQDIKLTHTDTDTQRITRQMTKDSTWTPSCLWASVVLEPWTRGPLKLLHVEKDAVSN